MATISIQGIDYDIGECYQTVYRGQVGVRSCDDRLDAILKADHAFNDDNMLKGTVCDWGSNLGYFSLSIGERTDQRVFGVECDPAAFRIAQQLKIVYGRDNVEFVLGRVPQDAPPADTNLALSVLHHIDGDQAFAIMGRGKTMYLELAHHHEHPRWAQKIKPENPNVPPTFYWHERLEKIFPDFCVRLIGVHNTHLGSLRPLFQLKRKIQEIVVHDGKEYNVYDRFAYPFVGGNRPHDRRYAYATHDGKRYFLKENQGAITVSDYIDGYLLLDIIRFGLLPYYDKKKLVGQIMDGASGHTDPHCWNAIVNKKSELFWIDTDDIHVSKFGTNPESLANVRGLLACQIS